MNVTENPGICVLQKEVKAPGRAGTGHVGRDALVQAAEALLRHDGGEGVPETQVPRSVLHLPVINYKYGSVVVVGRIQINNRGLFELSWRLIEFI
jgi:hypothetical protein